LLITTRNNDLLVSIWAEEYRIGVLPVDVRRLLDRYYETNDWFHSHLLGILAKAQKKVVGMAL
jgi:hypothetical protein